MKTAVIIGGGLGGLFTGGVLAKEGFKVTVLEKNVTAGGGLVRRMILACTSLVVCSQVVTSIASVSTWGLLIRWSW